MKLHDEYDYRGLGVTMESTAGVYMKYAIIYKTYNGLRLFRFTPNTPPAFRHDDMRYHNKIFVIGFITILTAHYLR